MAPRHGALVVDVEVACRLVEGEDPRHLVKGPGEEDALAPSAGILHSP
jgi:hypothetical protein